MELDATFLSRVQFALTVMFHYLFPPLTIGMGVVLVYLEGMYLKTRDPLYETAARFWTGLFAVTFAIGVATGIVMEFQFGTNWAAYSRFVGDVFGSALAAEGIFAFFLESGFLAILVFGWDKVSAGVHFFAALMVALGSMFSAVWIVVANSWQQTPAGHHIVQMMRDGQPWVVDGKPVMRAEIVDFWALVFNPSTINRLTHVWIGSWILGAFFIMSISAWYLLKGRHIEFAKRSFTGALMLGTVASLLAAISGDFNARMVGEHQPAKLAAFEGHFETGPADLTLFGVPDSDAMQMRYNVAVPGGTSLLFKGDPKAEVLGLDRFRPEDRPPVGISFWSFHVMVGLGTVFIILTLYASFLRWRNQLFDKRWLLWVFVFAVFGPFVANEIGWVAAEVGRQPWVVHPPMVVDASGAPVLDSEGFVTYETGQGLRTSEGVSESVSGAQVLGSIVMFSLIYVLLFAVWVFVLDLKIKAGPKPVEPPPHSKREAWRRAVASRAGHEDSLSEAKG